MSSQDSVFQLIRKEVGRSPKEACTKTRQWPPMPPLLPSESELTLEDLVAKAGYDDPDHLVHGFKVSLFHTPGQLIRHMNPLIKDFLKFPVASA